MIKRIISYVDLGIFLRKPGWNLPEAAVVLKGGRGVSNVSSSLLNNQNAAVTHYAEELPDFTGEQEYYAFSDLYFWKTLAHPDVDWRAIKKECDFHALFTTLHQNSVKNDFESPDSLLGLTGIICSTQGFSRSLCGIVIDDKAGVMTQPSEFAYQSLLAGGVLIGCIGPGCDGVEERYKFGDYEKATPVVLWPHDDEPSFGPFPGWDVV